MSDNFFVGQENFISEKIELEHVTNIFETWLIADRTGAINRQEVKPRVRIS